MSSTVDPSRLKKIFVIPVKRKTYPGKNMMGVQNKGSLIILAPPKTDPLKSIDCSNTADLERKKITIEMSKIRLLKDPPTKPSGNGNQPIQNTINQTPSKQMEHKPATSENVNTEVVWLPTALERGKKSLVLENENIESLHSENESDEDRTSVSDQSDSENELLNSSGDTQHNNSNNTTPQKDNNGIPHTASTISEQDLNKKPEKLNQSDRKITFNPKNILQQLKAINSTEIEISRREYCQEWLEHQELSGFEQDQKLFNFLSSKLKPSRALESREFIKSIVSSYSYQLSHMWTESGKDMDKLYKEYSDWLNGPTIKLTASRPVNIQPTLNAPDKLVRIYIETNADAFKFLKNLELPFKADELIKLIPCTDLTPEQKDQLNDFCNRYVADMKFKWLTTNYNEHIFFNKFECWLKLNIKWPVFLKDLLRTQKKSDTETVANEEFIISSNISEEVVMKMISNCKINTIEKILASKCLETGRDISKIIHRVIHHPEDAALITSVSHDRECSCYPKLTAKKIPDEYKKFKPPSQVQKEVLKMTVERLKDSMPAPKDPLKEDTTDLPIHKRHAVQAESHQAMMNQILCRLKVANLPVKIEEINQANIISKVNHPLIIHDDYDEIETNQANERGDKIDKGGVVERKVVRPAKTNKQQYQPILINTLISTAKKSLLNSREMVVDTPMDDIDDTIDIDNDDNLQNPTEQTNENNHENLEFGPVLDKLIFIQPLNLKHGTIIRLQNNIEAMVSKVSNCSATVLVPKFIKKSGSNVHVRKSNYKIKRLVKTVAASKKNTASSNTGTEKQTPPNKNHGILQDSPGRSQQSITQMQSASRKVSVLGNTKRKEEIVSSVRSSPSSSVQQCTTNTRNSNYPVSGRVTGTNLTLYLK